MTRKRSARWIYQVTTAMGLALFATACATFPEGGRNLPDPANEVERAQMLMRYCGKLVKTGDLRVAASICHRAYETNPSDSAPLYKLAEIYKEMGASAQAADVYRQALIMNPDDFDALYGLAKTSIDLGQYEEAESQLERALQVNDQDPRVYNALGIVKDQKGEHEVAQALYRTGLLIDPDNVPLRNNLGLSLALTGDQGESIELLRGLAGEPGAGTVSSQNLALASTYKAPSKPGTDGPVVIRSTDSEDMAEAPEAMSDGDTKASAKSKPLHKTAGKPAVALGGKKNGKDGKPVELGSATGSLAEGGESGQDVAAGMPTEFLASNDHSFQKDKASAEDGAAKAKSSKKGLARSKKAKSKAATGKQVASKAAKGKKGREYKVQLGAYQSQARADQAWKALMSKTKDLLGDLPHSVVKAETGTQLGTVYRLQAGSFFDRAAGDSLCAQLKSRNVGCFVVALPSGKAPVKPAAKPATKVEKKPLAIEPKALPAQGGSAPKGAPKPLMPDASKGAAAPSKPSNIQG